MSGIESIGHFTVYPTPFDDDLNVDFKSIDTLVDFLVETGVKCLAILGFMGEA